MQFVINGTLSCNRVHVDSSVRAWQGCISPGLLFTSLKRNIIKVVCFQ